MEVFDYFSYEIPLFFDWGVYHVPSETGFFWLFLFILMVIRARRKFKGCKL